MNQLSLETAIGSMRTVWQMKQVDQAFAMND